MTIAQILVFLQGLLPALEPILVNEENALQAQIKAYLAAQNQNSDLVQLLVAIDGALDAFAQMEIKKI